MQLLGGVSMEARQTLKAVLSLWSDAAEAYSSEDFDGTIDKFLQVEDLSARMLYNMACAYIRLNKMTLALQCLSAAVKKDEHLAIAYFQKGVLNLKQNSLKSAIEDFSRAKTLMRANNFIDYKPLGMIIKLWKFEILYNLALAHLRDNHKNEAEILFAEALHDSDVRQRKSLIAALEHVQENRADLVLPIEISIKSIFTPPKSVVDNLTKKHKMESAKVVIAADKDDTDPSFNGMKRLAELRLKSPPGTPKPRRIPKSPLTKVKRFLFSQNGMSNKKMRPAYSTGDILSLTNMTRTPEIDICQSHTSTDLKRQQYSRSCEGEYGLTLTTSSSSSMDEVFQSETNSPNGSLRILQSTSFDDDRLTSDSNKNRHPSTIEEACSTSATCIARALSANCDVTIVVTPPAVDAQELSKRLLTSATLKGNENNSNDDTDSPKTLKLKCDVIESDIKTTVVQKSIESITSPKGTRKVRPPPPSYPPPPLPSKVLFTV